jgi:hypothetical protein
MRATKLGVALAVTAALGSLPHTACAQRAAEGGAFVLADIQASRVNEGFGALLGFSVGWETESQWQFAASVYDLLNGTPLPERRPEDPKLRTKMHLYGFTLGKHYMIGKPRLGSRFGLGGTVLLGAGDVSTYQNEKNQDRDRSWFLVAQPTVTVRFPDLRYFRWQLGVGYRIAIGVQDGGTDTDKLGGPFVSLTLGLANLKRH